MVQRASIQTATSSNRPRVQRIFTELHAALKARYNRPIPRTSSVDLAESRETTIFIEFFVTLSTSQVAKFETHRVPIVRKDRGNRNQYSSRISSRSRFPRREKIIFSKIIEQFRIDNLLYTKHSKRSPRNEGLVLSAQINIRGLPVAGGKIVYTRRFLRRERRYPLQR